MESIVEVSQDQVSSGLGSGTAILNLNTGVYYGLDAVGSRVWALLEKPKTVAQIRDTLTEEYDVEADRCERELLEMLGKLSAAGLIRAAQA